MSVYPRTHEFYVRISELKRNLRKTDYMAIKYAEGELPIEEYAETLAQRRAWRVEINELEAEILAIKNKGKVAGE